MSSRKWPSYMDERWRDKDINISSVQFSRSVVSDSLLPHELQHARPPYPSATPRVHSDSRPSSPWCHPAISSSVGPFSSCPQSLPALESFPMSQLLTWGGQSIGVSALASVLPMNTQNPSKSILDIPNLWLDLVGRLYHVSLISMWNIFSLTKFKVIFFVSLLLLLFSLLFCFVEEWKSFAKLST